jgi:hypothetical protein
MNTSENSAPDLVWSLDNISDKEKAASFLRLFERSLCVFSGAVSQLYASYSISQLSHTAGTLVVIPDPYASHDTFQAKKDRAVAGTGLFIIPGEAAKKTGGLYLMHRNRKTGKYNTIPLHDGIRRISAGMAENNPFLPVITNKDLRELPNRAPILHLHRLDARKLDHLSNFQIGDISRTITDKMDSLFGIGRQR